MCLCDLTRHNYSEMKGEGYGISLLLLLLLSSNGICAMDLLFVPIVQFSAASIEAGLLRIEAGLKVHETKVRYTYQSYYNVFLRGKSRRRIATYRPASIFQSTHL